MVININCSIKKIYKIKTQAVNNNNNSNLLYKEKVSKKKNSIFLVINLKEKLLKKSITLITTIYKIKISLIVVMEIYRKICHS